MNRLTVTLGAVIVASVLVGDCPAANPVFPKGDARRSMGNLRPSTPHGRTHKSPPATGHSHHHRPNLVYYYPRYGGVYRDPYYRDSYGYDYPYTYRYWRPRYYAPVFLPAGILYGPEAVKRFMGVGGVNRQRVNVVAAPPVARPVNAGPVDARPVDARPVDVGPDPAAAAAKALATARNYIDFGDIHFRKQKYADAHLRYHRAVREAPELADGYFRKGYAMITQGNYDLAARALKRGLALDPAWPDSGFSSQQLYGNNDEPKRAHLDALAKAAEKAPNDPDLMFLLGVFLHFDDQPDRAAIFFGQAARLNRGDDAHLRAFSAGN